MLEACVTIPAVAVSHIMLEAYKKYLLIWLIVHGDRSQDALTFPKYTSPVVSKYIRPLCAPYQVRFGHKWAFIINLRTFLFCAPFYSALLFYSVLLSFYSPFLHCFLKCTLPFKCSYKCALLHWRSFSLGLLQFLRSFFSLQFTLIKF